MENLVIKNCFNNIFSGKKVLVTGHTGFKGSWLVNWLHHMGANVIGFSKDFVTEPNHFSLLNISIIDIRGDIRDYNAVLDTLKSHQPDIIFHLAAQPLVKYSYYHPLETFETNVVGTINVLQASREINCVKAIVNVTSDKCYENQETNYAYKETDRLGGYDPYSASKACAELVATSFRSSFFNIKSYGYSHETLIASVRAGNVIGGGDWALDRLIPDIVRAYVENRKVIIRHPDAVRPWQHVLESLSGYLLVGQKLLEKNISIADAWNFGPLQNEAKKVKDVLHLIKNEWKEIEFEFEENSNLLHEAKLLSLDCSKAEKELAWLPVWTTENSIKKTANWYKKYYLDNQVLTNEDLQSYINDAIKKKVEWAIM